MKTINILKKEFETNLIDLIQSSNIPACILQDIFDKYLRQLSDIAERDYKRDMQKLQQEEKEKDENESDE